MLDRLIAHMHWANGILIDWLQREGGADVEACRLAAHVLMAEDVWLRRVHGRPYAPDGAFLPLPLNQMAAKNRENHAAFTALLEGDLSRSIEYRLMNGSPGKSTVEDILLHVATHGFHHRGQLASMASRAGRPLPNISYIHLARIS